MASKHLGVYLNDHLAGSVLALELLARLEQAHTGSPLGQSLSRLRLDILADQQELKALISGLGLTASAPRQAMAWLTEKFGVLKLALDDPADGPLRLLEALELIAIGIHGKGALWRALAAARVSGPDYQRLENRAIEQRERIESARLDAAVRALNLES